MALSRTVTRALCAAMLVPLAPAIAATADPAGDFLPSFVGPQNGDLDVLSIDAAFASNKVVLSATVAADIGTTAGALYAWGIDRGQGAALFVGGAPSIGAGVLFDSVLVVRPDGTGNFLDLLNPANNFALPVGSVSISGAAITAVVALSGIPSTGFSVADYGYNLWPRAPGAGNAFVSDFAPDASTIKASGVVPEPASWALMIAGFGLVGVAVRGRRQHLAG
ncbi:MAG: PEPxxWA-CTERM sorting domain-containing protein, partial [Sandaracinobacteroides sp.]